MARITIADCLKFVDNRFELVRTAAKRARQLAKGATALVPSDNDKPTVLALREIANGQHYYLGGNLNLAKTEQATEETMTPES